jgi:UDP-N-acetylmuramate dehydrogenase
MRPPPLPPLRGRLIAEAPLGAQTWFRVGGPAELLFRPADAEDLAAFLTAWPTELPLTVLGAASNVIIRDGGLPGAVIQLRRGFSGIEIAGERLIAGAGVLDVTLAEHAAQAGIAGLEFLCGIPGTLGGAVAMNAGAYGSEIADVLDWAELVLRSGERVRLSAAELGLAYRHAALPPGAVVVRVALHGRAGSREGIAARMQEIRARREATQPVRARTGGSTFRNPLPHESSLKAWELIDLAGCRGLRRGAAMVSPLHCNFLINEGGASAADLEGLGEEVRARVRAATGVELAWEIRRLGQPASAESAAGGSP